MSTGSLIFLALDGVILVLMIIAAVRPDRYGVERQVTIAAPAERIFGLLDDFRRWPDWAPQDRLDRTLRRTYGGAASGVGAESAWSGTNRSGRGRMRIAEATPCSRVVVEVDFDKPFKTHNVNQFSLEPADGGTRVTWAMQGTQPFVAKLMGIFVNMDKMVGKHFEIGLRFLKIAAEGAPDTAAPSAGSRPPAAVVSPAP